MSERLRDVQNFLIAQRRIKNQSDFGAIMGKSRSQLSEYVNGRRRVTRDLAFTISEYFPEIDPQFLMDEKHTQMLRPAVNVQGNNNAVNNGRDFSLTQLPPQTTFDAEALMRTIEALNQVIMRQDGQLARYEAMFEKIIHELSTDTIPFDILAGKHIDND